MNVEVFCGGAVQTNAYLLSHNGIGLAVDAPEGMADWVKDHCHNGGIRLAALLLTHGHWDHILDAAKIQQQLKTPVWIHRDSAPLLENPAIQEAFNPSCQMQPCRADRVLDRESRLQLEIFKFELLLCPGHCPGSLCFYFGKEKMLFGGDVLFAGGVGRWDLPGGSETALMNSIQQKILVLPDDTEVFPGHGSSTTIGDERRTNPYLLGLVSKSGSAKTQQ